MKSNTQQFNFSDIAHGMWRLHQWNMSTGQLQHFVEEAIGVGITTFDHADIYGNYTCENIFGIMLAQSPSLRQQMQLVTKCGIRLISENRPENTFHTYDTSAGHIIRSAERSLKNFRTDYLDLLLIHRPDPLMDATEVAKAFTDLRNSGKVLHFGVSNFAPWQFDLLQSHLAFPLVTNQVEVSLLNMDAMHDGTLDQCQRFGIRPMAWSPLAGGNLFGEAATPQAVRLQKTLSEIAAEMDAAPDQVALAWLLRHPARIVPVVGTGNIDRLRGAAAALKLQLSREYWFRLWTASAGHEVP
ncbi:MAG: oxidoreductase [Clostridia bacterium]|nr:oxidoreductase [Clostridia bacterium]